MAVRASVALSVWLLPLGLFVGLLAYVGFWGVNLQDGGLILAQSRRLLFGEIPHRDFITPRPAGSAFLHLLDFALPFPLEISSKVVTIAEIVAYGVLFSLFVYRTRLDRLTLAESAGVIVAVLVGMHQFPIIPFYSFDGLVLTGGGLLLLQRALPEARLRTIGWAFFLLGIATTTKQSFWFAPFFAFAWLFIELVVRRQPIRRPIAVAVGACAIAPALYVIYVGVGGGFGQMYAEMTQTTPVYGDVLLTELRDPHLRSQLLPSLGVLTAVLVLVYLPRRIPPAVSLAARTIGTLVVLRLVTEEQLGFNRNWSQRLFWCVIVATVVRSIARRRPDVAGFTAAFVAWMVTLSWGAPTPALAAGVSAVYLGEALWRGSPAVDRR